MILIKLNSDNWDGDLFTPDAYEHIALEMSTGDSATHTTECVVCPEEYAPTYQATYIQNGTTHLLEINSDNELWNPSTVGGK